MAGKLRELLTKPTTSRTTSDYDALFNDFISFAGGSRIDHVFEVPDGVENADYFLATDRYDCLLELKQVRKYDKGKTINSYFSDLSAKGALSNFDRISESKIRIRPDSLSRKQWKHFYKKFRPDILADLGKANRQLKATDQFAELKRARRIKGVFILNTGDFNLPTDLLFRIIERKMKYEWKDGNFRNIDFVTCCSVDMFCEGQHPLHSRHIVKTIADEFVVEGVQFLFDKWIRFAAVELGLAIDWSEETSGSPIGFTIDRPFTGKIQWNPPIPNL